MVSPTTVNNESWHALAEDTQLFLYEILQAAKVILRTLHKEVDQTCKTLF
jgi:TRAP-type C4-dicarboxylate transport system substrate-binding protein